MNRVVRIICDNFQRSFLNTGTAVGLHIDFDIGSFTSRDIRNGSTCFENSIGRNDISDNQRILTIVGKSDIHTLLSILSDFSEITFSCTIYSNRSFLHLFLCPRGEVFFNIHCEMNRFLSLDRVIGDIGDHIFLLTESIAFASIVTEHDDTFLFRLQFITEASICFRDAFQSAFQLEGNRLCPEVTNFESIEKDIRIQSVVCDIRVEEANHTAGFGIASLFKFSSRAFEDFALDENHVRRSIAAIAELRFVGCDTDALVESARTIIWVISSLDIALLTRSNRVLGIVSCRTAATRTYIRQNQIFSTYISEFKSACNFATFFFDFAKIIGV